MTPANPTRFAAAQGPGRKPARSASHRPAISLLLTAFLVAGLLLSLSVPAGATASTRSLRLGFFSDPVLNSGSSASQEAFLGDVVSEGASIVRVNLYWSNVAPAEPPAGFQASNPGSTGYDWTAVDAEIRALSSRGIAVLLNVQNAPKWAEGAGMPAGAQPGTWKPSPTALAAFAKAAATRYDGRYPDPLNAGSTLPRVSSYQVWNEPNLNFYLSPQWTKVGRRYTPVAPGLFRTMANDFYAAVKSVSASNYVVLGGTAPYGDPPGGTRMQPVTFDQYLFCLKGTNNRPTACPHPVHANAIDNHPYAVSGPLSPALNADDVSIIDVHKLVSVLRAAQQAKHILPRGSKQVWATEFSWDSNPPDPQGVPIDKQALWLEQSLYLFWRQGVSTAMWYQLVDSPPDPSYAATYQAGLYFLNGQPKPAATAYRFPFVTARRSRTTVEAWGHTTLGGTVQIERQTGSSWSVIRSVSVGANGTYDLMLRLSGSATLRAVEGSQVSLTWSQPK